MTYALVRKFGSIILLNHPEYVELEKLADGKYTIKSQVSNGGSSQYFNGSYMDGSATGIAIITIDGKTYISASDNTFCFNNNGVVGSHAAMDQVWTITSLADMDAKMATATAEEPMDITYKLVDPNFGRNNIHVGDWERENVTKGGDNANQLYEAFHIAFSIKQTVKDLPNGLYEVRANGFYRQDGEDTNLPYIFANEAQSTFPVRGEAAENNMTDAAASFAQGNYPISVKVLVTNGEITLGATTTGTTCWSIFDNFQLYYLGNSIEVPVSVNGTAKYGTFCAPFDVKIAYYVNGYTVEEVTDNVLTLSEIADHKVPAHTPIVINYNGTYFETFTGTVTEGTPKAGLLVGTYNDITAPAGSYVLQNHSGVVGFYQVGETKPTVKAFRAYLQTESEVKGFYFNQTDAINAIEALTNGAKIYDINGRELNKLQKGINIVNGCKILVK